MLEINFLELTMLSCEELSVEEDGRVGTEAGEGGGDINNIRLTSCYKHIIRSAVFTPRLHHRLSSQHCTCMA